MTVTPKEIQNITLTLNVTVAHSVGIPPHRKGFTLVSSLLKIPVELHYTINWWHNCAIGTASKCRLNQYREFYYGLISSCLHNEISYISKTIYWYCNGALIRNNCAGISTTYSDSCDTNWKIVTNIEMRGWLMSSSRFTTNKVGTWSLLMLHNQHDKMRTFELNHTNRLPIGDYKIPRE